MRRLAVKIADALVAARKYQAASENARRMVTLSRRGGWHAEAAVNGAEASSARN